MRADLDLVKDVKAGDKLAYGELVTRHQRAIYRLALRFTGDHGVAEDVVQESFIKAYQKINFFEERSSFKSWLFRIAINTCKNRWRGKTHLEVDIADVVIGVEETATRGLELEETQKLLQVEVQKLPERQRTALSLRIFEDMSFQEIAKIMDCPYDTAKANYRHAVLKLKKVFTDHRLALDLEEGGEDTKTYPQYEPNGE